MSSYRVEDWKRNSWRLVVEDTTRDQTLFGDGIKQRNRQTNESKLEGIACPRPRNFSPLTCTAARQDTAVVESVNVKRQSGVRDGRGACERDGIGDTLISDPPLATTSEWTTTQHQITH